MIKVYAEKQKDKIKSKKGPIHHNTFYLVQSANRLAKNFTLKARSEPHKHLFFPVFHDKNTGRFGSRYSNYIPQNKVFNKVISQNEIECYRFKKEPSEN
jgi:hypothetical protein